MMTNDDCAKLAKEILARGEYLLPPGPELGITLRGYGSMMGFFVQWKSQAGSQQVSTIYLIDLDELPTRLVYSKMHCAMDCALQAAMKVIKHDWKI